MKLHNGDNLFFDGKTLELEHEGLRNSAYYEEILKNGLCMAVFDGKDGKRNGEVASFTAA